MAHEKFGRLEWKDLFAPTIKLCRDGFRVSSVLARALQMAKSSIKLNAALSKVFVSPNTKDVYLENDQVKWPDLANTLELIAEKGIDVFYKGELTPKMVQEINENGLYIQNSLFIQF